MRHEMWNFHHCPTICCLLCQVLFRQQQCYKKKQIFLDLQRRHHNTQQLSSVTSNQLLRQKWSVLFLGLYLSLGFAHLLCDNFNKLPCYWNFKLWFFHSPLYFEIFTARNVYEQTRQLSTPSSAALATYSGASGATPFLSTPSALPGSSIVASTPSCSNVPVPPPSTPSTSRTVLTPTSGSLKLTVNRRAQTSSLTNHARVCRNSLGTSKTLFVGLS